MEEPIKDISLKFACDADWDQMADLGNARYCTKCREKVYDFTNAKQNEFLRILAESNSVCGRFAPAQMADPVVQFPRWKRWISAAAMILLGVNLWSCNGSTLGQGKMGKAKITPSKNVPTASSSKVSFAVDTPSTKKDSLVMGKPLLPDSSKIHTKK